MPKHSLSTHLALSSLLCGLGFGAGCADVEQTEARVSDTEVMQQQTSDALVQLVGIPESEGPGCRAGTFELDTSQDDDGLFRTVLTFYSMRLASSSAATQAALKCRLKLTFSSRPDVSMALDEALFRGRAIFEKGVTGAVVTNAAFSSFGLLDTNKRTTSISGPRDHVGEPTGSFLVAHAAKPLRWLPCGARDQLLVDLEIRLDAPASSGGRTNSITLNEAVLSTPGVVPGSSERPGVVTTFALRDCPSS